MNFDELLMQTEIDISLIISSLGSQTGVETQSETCSSKRSWWINVSRFTCYLRHNFLKNWTHQHLWIIACYCLKLHSTTLGKLINFGIVTFCTGTAIIYLELIRNKLVACLWYHQLLMRRWGCSAWNKSLPSQVSGVISCWSTDSQNRWKFSASQGRQIVLASRLPCDNVIIFLSMMLGLHWTKVVIIFIDF